MQRSAKLQLSREQAKCPQDFSGLIPNYADCSKFIQCNSGIQTPRDCPPGTLFDTNLNVCNHARETTCFSGQTGTSFGIKEEYGGSTDTTGMHGNNKWQNQGSYGQYTNQNWRGNVQSQHQDQTGQYWNQYGSSTGQSNMQSIFDGQHYKNVGSQGQGAYGCDPTNPYCQSGGYIISGSHIYYMSPHPSTGNTGRDSRYYSGSSQGEPCNPQLYNCQQQGSATQGLVQVGTVYIQYVMCDPSVEDCTTFQTGTYMLGPGGALCDPARQQCGQGTAYIPNSKMSGSANTYGQNTVPTASTYYVKYVMCNTEQQNCSQYQKGTIEAGYGVPGTLIGAKPVGESGTSSSSQPQGQISGSNGKSLQNPTQSYGSVSGSHGKSGQPCNPQYQQCDSSQYPSSYGQISGSPVQSGQPCNPQFQHCSTSQYPTQSYGGQVSGSHGKSGQPCNPQYQQCGQDNTVQYQGQFRPSVSSDSQVSGSHGKSGQPCNPLYQDCSGGSYNPNCNPQLQNCGSFAGQNKPSVSSYDQISGSQGAPGYSGHGTSSSQPGQYPQTYNRATNNYKKICRAGDDNCYRKNQNAQSNQGSGGEPKCPHGFQGVTKHPTNCKKFLNCANGITYIQDCGPGTLFNPFLGACDFPYNVDCKEGEEESTTTEYSQETDGYPYPQGPYEKIEGKHIIFYYNLIGINIKIFFYFK